MKNWIYHHSIGFLNYTSVFSNSAILLGLPNAPRNLFSKLLTCILSAVKTGLQIYCDTSYSTGGVNQLWILKKPKDMLEYIQSRSLSSCNRIKTIDFSTLYTTIPHSKLKVQLCFIKKNGQRRYKYLVLGRDRSYFGKNTTLILPKSSLKLISSRNSSV